MASTRWLAAKKSLASQARTEQPNTIFREESEGTKAWRELVQATCQPLIGLINRVVQDGYLEGYRACKGKAWQGQYLTRETSFEANSDKATDYPSENPEGPKEALILAVVRTADAVLTEILKRPADLHPLVSETLFAVTEACYPDPKPGPRVPFEEFPLGDPLGETELKALTKADLAFKNLFFLRLCNAGVSQPENFGLEPMGIDLKILRGLDPLAYSNFRGMVAKEMSLCCCKAFEPEPKPDRPGRHARWNLPVVLFAQKVSDDQVFQMNRALKPDLRSAVLLTLGSKPESEPRKRTREQSSCTLALARDALPEGQRLRDLNCYELCKVLHGLWLFPSVQPAYDLKLDGAKLRKMEEEELKKALRPRKKAHLDRLKELKTL